MVGRSRLVGWFVCHDFLKRQVSYTSNAPIGFFKDWNETLLWTKTRLIKGFPDVLCEDQDCEHAHGDRYVDPLQLPHWYNKKIFIFFFKILLQTITILCMYVLIINIIINSKVFKSIACIIKYVQTCFSSSRVFFTL